MLAMIPAYDKYLSLPFAVVDNFDGGDDDTGGFRKSATLIMYDDDA